MARAVVADPAWVASARAGLESAGNLSIRIHGTVEVKLLPRPMVMVRDVTIDDRMGIVALTAPVVRATLSVPDLLRGHAVLDRVQIDDVTGSIDADAAARDLALHAEAPPVLAAAGTALPSRIAITSGLVQIVSARPGLSGFLSDLHGAADGFDGGAASLSGSANWHGERAEISGRLDSLMQFIAGKPASGAVRLKSRLVSASLNGTWTQGWRGGFHGSVTASTPEFPGLLRLAGLSTGLLGTVGPISFSGMAEPSEGGVAFASAHLVVNGDTLEGSLAVQSQDGRLTLVGTLATDALDLTPFAAALPSPQSQEGGWAHETIPFSPGDLHDVDLRISAGQLRLKGLAAEDTGLSVLCRNGRMEVSLGEARAYGGIVKGRLFSNADAATLALKLDASWSQVNVASLAKAVDGLPAGVTGTTTGSLTAEARGQTASALVRTLEGKGQMTWHQGTMVAPPVLDALLRPEQGRDSESQASELSFDLAAADFRISEGTLAIGKASLTTPDARVTVSGQMSLPHQTYALSSTVASTDPVATDPLTAPVRRIAGLWGGPGHQIESLLDRPASGAEAAPGGYFP